MAFTFRSPRAPLLPFSYYPFQYSSKIFPELPRGSLKSPRSIVICSASSNQQFSPSTSEQAVLDAIASFDATQKSLPSVRTFQNELARLSLVGAVDFQQALTAAAADGGKAADEHISSGTSAMVVETIFPANDLSTISTRLFLPARKVKEKAIKLRKSLTKDILDNTNSNNILAMTFRQVVLQQLRSFELALFKPGTRRDMDSLENPREVSVLLSLKSSDERIIARIGEVVCVVVLGNIEKSFFRNSMKKVRNKFFNTNELVSSKDSSVFIYNFLEHEILANSKKLLEKFNLGRGNYKLNKLQKPKGGWLTSPALAKLEKIGGAEFCAWVSEYIPSYKLVIDDSKLSNVEFEGWEKSEANSWEVFLTHSQMVSLADILDMYYEDVFTLPDKRLACCPIAISSKVSLNKGSSFLKLLSIVVASGIFLVTISVLRKVYLPHLPSRMIHNSQPQSSDINCPPLHSVDFSQVRECCVSIIRRIKNSFGWPGDIRIEIMNSTACAWIGEVPMSLRIVDDVRSNILDNSSTSMPPKASEEEMKALQEIASYQVVLSTNGDIIGLQPTNRLAVNNWAANPLAKDLYGGKNLSPGLLEPGLKMSLPSGVVVLELLMSVNPDSYFAVARAVDIGRK